MAIQLALYSAHIHLPSPLIFTIARIIPRVVYNQRVLRLGRNLALQLLLITAIEEE